MRVGKKWRLLCYQSAKQLPLQDVYREGVKFCGWVKDGSETELQRCTSVIPAFQRQRQENHEFEASLSSKKRRKTKRATLPL
jgi:hypothetical protein